MLQVLRQEFLTENLRVNARKWLSKLVKAAEIVSNFQEVHPMPPGDDE
jgi:hypothetical protein